MWEVAKEIKLFFPAIEFQLIKPRQIFDTAWRLNVGAQVLLSYSQDIFYPSPFRQNRLEEEAEKKILTRKKTYLFLFIMQKK